MPKVLNLIAKRKRLLFLDEAVFTSRSVMSKVWAKNSDGAVISKDKYGFACVAVVAAIDVDGKLISCVTSAKSIKEPEFCKILK